MRQKLIFLVMLLCSVYASAVDLIETGPQRTLTKEDALEVAQAQFKNKDEAPDNSLIQITSVVDGLVKKTEILNAGLREHIIDSGSLEKGVYTLTYLVNDEIIDTKKVKVE